MNNFDLEKIRSTGYWTFVFHPLVESKEKISLSTLKKLIIDNGIHLRGWPFPYYDISDLHRETNGISLGIKFQEIYEYWKFFESGQFVAQFAMIEDRLEEYRGSKVLFILSTLYRITECIMFAANISAHEVYSEGMYLEIILHDCENRQLRYINQPKRDIINYLLDKFICKIKEPLKWQKTFIPFELQKNCGKYALDATIYFLERFGPFEENRKILETEQAKFLRGELK